MTIRQRLLRLIYPLFMRLSRFNKKNRPVMQQKVQPPVSFYSLQATMNNGRPFLFDQLKGKKVLIVNTASNCGYTNQYDDLQKLWKKYREELVVIGFPANDFKEQEKGSDEEIAEFCRINFGVDFPLMQKSTVVKTPEQNPVFRWLTDPSLNGWNSKVPEWNFSKYFIDEEGRLTHYFGPETEPLGKELEAAMKGTDS